MLHLFLLTGPLSPRREGTVLRAGETERPASLEEARAGWWLPPASPPNSAMQITSRRQNPL